MTNNIKAARELKGISQKDLADYLKISQQSVSLYENGGREPKLDTWKRIASYLDVSIPYLQGIQDNNVDKYISALWQLYALGSGFNYSIENNFDNYVKINNLKPINFDNYFDYDNGKLISDEVPDDFRNDLLPIIDKIINRTKKAMNYNEDFNWLSFNDWLDNPDDNNDTADIIAYGFNEEIDNLLNGKFNKQFEKDYKAFIKVCENTFSLPYDLKRVLSPSTEFVGTSKEQEIGKLTKKIDEYIKVMEDTKKKIKNIDVSK